MEDCDYNVMVTKIKAQMDKIGINARELADRACVGKSFVYDILSGKSTNPTSKKLMSIAKILGVPLSYLIGNESSPCDESNNIIPISAVHYLEFDNGRIAANTPMFYLPLNTKLANNIKNLRVYKMKGDSMYPTLIDQDLVLIDIEDRVPHPAGLFVIIDAVGMSIKRLEYLIDDNQSTKLHIMSDNKKYSAYETTVNNIEILGRIIWYARPLYCMT